ncbi:MAG: zinc ABC transporter substrate-binding protein [Pseudomonadota bacterium]|nr:zinc ABC transporter substrate-binding protein [Pseudomonadota bacterium]
MSIATRSLRRHHRSVARCLLAVLLLALPTWGAALEVGATIAPHAHFVEAIGSPHVRVVQMIPAQRLPETFEPSPRELAAAADLELYFAAGLAGEARWLDRLQGLNGHMRRVDLGTPAETAGRAAPTPDDHAHGAADPHLWTAPAQAARQVERIRDALSVADPAHAAHYAARAAAYLDSLAALDRELAIRLEPFAGRVFLVWHPAWSHFAAAYGLEQLAVEHEGKSPGPRGLIALKQRVAREGLHTLFVQPQNAGPAVAAVARELAVATDTLDPLAADYRQNLRMVAARLAAELQ